MKFEHKLSAGAAEAIAETQRVIRQMSDRYFNLLGQAKDAETEAMAQQKILQRQIALIQQLEKLPESRMPYMVNADGTALIGEVPEPAAETKPDSVWPRMTNGSGAVIEMARED